MPRANFRAVFIMNPALKPWASKWKLLSHVQLFATSWTIQSMEFSRPEYWSGYAFLSPGDLPNPGIEPRSPALQEDSLPTELWRKPLGLGMLMIKIIRLIGYPINAKGNFVFCLELWKFPALQNYIFQHISAIVE